MRSLSLYTTLRSPTPTAQRPRLRTPVSQTTDQRARPLRQSTAELSNEVSRVSPLYLVMLSSITPVILPSSCQGNHDPFHLLHLLRAGLDFDFNSIQIILPQKFVCPSSRLLEAFDTPSDNPIGVFNPPDAAMWLSLSSIMSDPFCDSLRRRS